MSESALLQRYGVFAVLAVLLHFTLFLGPSGEFSKVQLELHPGTRAVHLRLVNAMPREEAQRATVSKAVAPTPVAEPTKALVAPVAEPIYAAPSLPQAAAQAVAPVVRGEEKPSAVPAVSSAASDHSVSTPVEARGAEAVEGVASTAVPTAKPTSEGSRTASSALSSAVPPGVELEARAMSAHTPEYPSTSILRGEEGRVVVRLEVDTEGRAHQIELIEGSGHFRLDGSVLRFVREERFVPAQRGGTPIASTQTFSFRFELRDAPR